MTTVFWIIVRVLLFLLFTWIARRLLGVRRLSAARTLIASLAGLVAGFAIGVFLRRGGVDLDTAVLTSVALGLLFTMATVIVFETILGAQTHDTSRGLGRSIASRINVVRRSAEVTRILSRHGVGNGIGLVRGREFEPEEAKQLGESLRSAFEEAGGVFIKLGQLLATRPEVVPPELAAELGKLHSRVTPAPRDQIQPVIEESMGKPVEDVFTEFDWSAIGSASIGQVYRAELASGETVVVKVRRPGIVKNIERDLAVIDDLARVLEGRVEQARAMGLVSVVEEFSDQLRRELDYRVEARNMTDVGAVLADNADIKVPRVHEDLSDDQVIIMEFVRGTPVGELGAAPHNGLSLANSLFHAELNAMLRGDAFHADLHPGNVLVHDHGLALVDFGAIGRLDGYERAAVGDIIAALEIRDPTMLREAALGVGMKSDTSDVSGLDRSFSRLMADHLSTSRDPSFEVFSDFIKITQAHGLRMPASVSEMMRALATLDGTVRLLAPEFNVVSATRALAREEMLESLSPETLGDDLKREVVRLAPLIRRAPYQLDRIAGQLARGETTVRVSLFSDA